MSDDLGRLIEKVKAKDFQALAKLLSRLEREGPGLLKSEALLHPPQPSFRVGVTGPPGAGKSTLIGQLIKEFLDRNLSVGILAIDPSSPFTQGAILGDRIRYTEFLDSDKIFVRSVGTRGSLGGLSAAAYLMLRAFDLVGFDLVLIETVGVGQTELEVIHVADYVSVVLVPESGDSVQAMKAGLLEIADHFVVNKSDRPGAESIARELEALTTRHNEHAQVTKTVATEGKGVSELADLYLKMAQNPPQSRQDKERLQWEARALMRSSFEDQIESKVQTVSTPEQLSQLFD